MITTNNLGALLGATVLGPDDDKVGTIAQLFVDPNSGTPNWMTVTTGWFGTHETFVPLENATWDDECVHVGFDKEFIKGAPRVDTGGGLSLEEEDDLYRYYSDDTDHRDDRRSAAAGQTATTAPSMQRASTTPADTADTSHTADTGDTSHTANTGNPAETPWQTQMPTGGARMRKYVVTEVFLEDDQSASDSTKDQS